MADMQVGFLYKKQRELLYDFTRWVAIANLFINFVI